MLYTIVAVLVLVLDQAVKFWTVNNIAPQAIGDECVKLIPGVLHLTNVQNSGAAFSILADQRWLLIGVSAVFIIGIIVLISMDIIHTKFGRWTAILVMAGALGNCIDRVLYGYVVDMFEFELFSFVVFNLADVFITVCGILFCIHVIVYREPIEEYNAVPRKQRGGKKRAPAEEDDYELEAEEEEEEEPYEEEPRPRRKAAKAAKAAKGGDAKARPKKKDKPDPYANIPKRGEHRPLADEIRPQNPDDPFAEWGFGSGEAEPRKRRSAPAAEDEAPAPRKRRPVQEEEDEAPAPRKRRPAPVQEPEEEEDERPARRPAAAQTRQPAPQQPAKKQQPLDAGFGDYSLEDILSEFRDS